MEMKLRLLFLTIMALIIIPINITEALSLVPFGWTMLTVLHLN